MKIACLVSGGVDSSVAMALLKEQGHELTAYYLKIWLEDELSYLGECPWEEDLRYARAVCEQLKVPLRVINLQKQYFDKVVSYAINEVSEGRTPNPDMLCNAQIKFTAFIEAVDEEYDKICTGHYALVDEINGRYYLKSVKDCVKDQTYFLAMLNQKQLSKAIFPVGNLLKKEVRMIAKKYSLANKDRKDSQGICFLGKIKYNDFLKHYLGEKQGNVINIKTGKKIGKHNGFWYHTIGQRRGLGLGQGPWYVVEKDTQKNIVYVSNEYQSLEDERTEFGVKNINWIGEKPDLKNKLYVKVRHGPKKYEAKLEETQDGVHVRIKEKDQGFAEGQFAVFYDDKYCYGGGMITLKS